MIIQDEKVMDLSVLTLEGRLDAFSSEHFMQFLKQVVGEHRIRIILDLKDLEFIDSTGVGILLSAYRLVESQGGALKICAIRNQVNSVFALTRLSQFFEFFPDRASALQAFSLHPGLDGPRQDKLV